MEELEYYQKKLDEMPKDFLADAVQYLKDSISEEDKQSICKEIDEKGLIEWVIPYHLWWGYANKKRIKGSRI